MNHQTSKLIVSLLLLNLLAGVAFGHAQDMKTMTLHGADASIGLAVPQTWQIVDSSPQAVEARSTDDLQSENLQRVVLRIVPLEAPLGELPANDRVGAYMKLLTGTLPVSGDFPTDVFSEIARFTWDGHEAAAFLAYSDEGYYGRWLGIAAGDDIIALIEQGTTLPPETPPDNETLALFDAMLADVALNGDILESDDMAAALKRMADPLALLGPVVAALRLEDGPEVRLAAPEGWQKRDATRSSGYPTNYLFEDDLRDLAPGENPDGAVVQISLMSEARLLDRLDATTLPAPHEVALAYLNTLLPNAAEEAQFGTPLDFDWTADIYAVLLPVQYAEYSQHLVVAELDGGLLILSLYAPDWEHVFPIWQNMLTSLTIDGELLPAEAVLDATSAAEFEGDVAE